MKIIRRIGLALALLAGLTLVGAPSANAAEGDPGTSFDNPIYVQPNVWVAQDQCGYANDKPVLVRSGDTMQYSFVSAWNTHHTYLLGQVQTGLIRGVYYAYPGVTPDQFGTYTIKYPMSFDPSGPC